MGYREGKPFSAQVLWLLSCKSLGLSASTAELQRQASGDSGRCEPSRRSWALGPAHLEVAGQGEPHVQTLKTGRKGTSTRTTVPTLHGPGTQHNPGDDNTPANPEPAFGAEGFVFVNAENIWNV